MLGNVIDKQCANSTAIIGRGDGPITLLTGRIPDLRLNCFAIDLHKGIIMNEIHSFNLNTNFILGVMSNTHLYAACGKLNANCRLGLQIEFIARET